MLDEKFECIYNENENRITYFPDDPEVSRVILEKNSENIWIRYERDNGRPDPTYYKGTLTELDKKLIEIYTIKHS